MPRRIAAVILDLAGWALGECQWAKDIESADDLFLWIYKEYPDLMEGQFSGLDDIKKTMPGQP